MASFTTMRRLDCKVLQDAVILHVFVIKKNPIKEGKRTIPRSKHTRIHTYLTGINHTSLSNEKRCVCGASCLQRQFLNRRTGVLLPLEGNSRTGSRARCFLEDLVATRGEVLDQPIQVSVQASVVLMLDILHDLTSTD